MKLHKCVSQKNIKYTGRGAIWVEQRCFKSTIEHQNYHSEQHSAITVQYENSNQPAHLADGIFIID